MKIAVLIAVTFSAILCGCGPYGSQAAFFAGIALAGDRLRIEYSDYVHRNDEPAYKRKVTSRVVSIELTIAVEGNASTAWLDSFKDRFDNTALVLYHACKGQMYIRKVTIRTMSTRGKILISPLIGDRADNSPMPGPGEVYTWSDVSSNRMGLGGDFPYQAFLRGWGYCRMGRGFDVEYRCTGCALGPLDPLNQVLEYCSTSTCTTGNECWQNYILKKYVNWTFPNGGYDPVPPENVTYIIETK